MGKLTFKSSSSVSKWQALPLLLIAPVLLVPFVLNNWYPELMSRYNYWLDLLVVVGFGIVLVMDLYVVFGIFRQLRSDPAQARTLTFKGIMFGKEHLAQRLAATGMVAFFCFRSGFNGWLPQTQVFVNNSAGQTMFGFVLLLLIVTCIVDADASAIRRRTDLAKSTT